MMRSLFLIITLLLALFTAVVSSAGQRSAFIRVELVDQQKIWQGERIIVIVTLYSDTFFSGSTRFELPSVDGLLIMESEDHPLLGTRRVDGISYTYKRHEITLFPLRSGDYVLPPFRVEFSSRGKNGRTEDQSFTTETLTFNALPVPGVSTGENVITTSDLKVRQQWNPAPGSSMVGDALTRTITRSADGLPGMAFAPLTLKPVDGLGIYSRQPLLEDRMQRGEFTGSRTESFTYVCEKKGLYTIGPETFTWWNPKTEELRKITLPSIEFEVQANPLVDQQESAGETISRPLPPFPWKRLLAMLLFTAALAWVLAERQRRLHEKNGLDGERALLEEFHQRARADDGAGAMQALINWLDASKFGGQPATLAHFSTQADDPQLTSELTALEELLYTDSTPRHWTGKRLSRAVSRACLNLRREHTLSRAGALPELN
ncbi:MAG: hypothetical protein ABFS19_05125 [Thermodesulfobacteriota bacterium]